MRTERILLCVCFAASTVAMLFGAAFALQGRCFAAACMAVQWVAWTTHIAFRSNTLATLLEIHALEF